MNPELRNLLRDAFETGYARGVQAMLDGELQPPTPREDTEAAMSGASSRWLAQLDETAQARS